MEGYIVNCWIIFEINEGGANSEKRSFPTKAGITITGGYAYQYR
jgi:hypothetical protein